MKKRILALTIGIVMLAGTLLGCGGNGGTTTETNGETTQEANGGDEATGTGEELVVLDVFINHVWYREDEFVGIIPELVKEATGVDLNVTIATDPQQLGVMIASGDLPDLIFTSEEVDRLSNSNLTISYTELEENYGASFAEVAPERVAIARNLSQDGDFYTILNHFSTPDELANLQVGAAGQPAIFYRRDLLEAVGIDGQSITSVEALMDALEIVRDEYEDMVPFGLGGWWKFQGLGNAVGIEAARFNPDTGEYSYVATTPEYRELLEIANRMYREGFITAEQYANENEGDSDQAAFNNQVVFHNAFLSYTDFAHLQAETRNLHPDAVWGVLPFLGDGWTGYGRGWSGVFVSRNVSDPYAAARLLTFLHSDEGRRASIWGREGIDFTLDEHGVPQFSEQFKEARSAGQLSEVFNWRFNFGSTLVEEIYLLFSGIDPELLEVFSTYGVNARTFPEVGISQPTAASSEGVIRERLEELRRVHDAKIIFTSSDEEFEEAYQEYMDALIQTGVLEYNEYMTNAIRETRENLGW